MEMSKWTPLPGTIKLNGPQRRLHGCVSPTMSHFGSQSESQAKRDFYWCSFLVFLFLWFYFCFRVLGHMSLSTPTPLVTYYQVSLNYILDIHKCRLQESDFTVTDQGICQWIMDLFSVGWETTRKCVFCLFCFSVCVKHVSAPLKEQPFWNLYQCRVFGLLLTYV